MFFSFPGDEAEYKIWLELCGIAEVTRRGYIVCERHFELDFPRKKRLPIGKRPSLFLPAIQQSSVLQRSEPNNSSNMIPLRSCENLLLFSDQTSSTSSEINLPTPFVARLDFRGLHIPTPTNDIDTNFQNCENCIKLHKNNDFYLKKNSELQKNFETVVNENKEIKSKLSDAEKEVTALQRKLKLLESELESYKNISLNTSGSNSEHLISILNKNNQARYSGEEKALCQSIYFRSPNCYRFMRETLGFPLPSYVSLYRWRPIKNVVPGFNFENLKQIKYKIGEYDKISRNVTLVFDEIIIKKDLKYNIHHDQIEGFEDDGETRCNKLAKHVLVFMVRGIFQNYKFVLNYFTSETVFSGKKLKSILIKNIELLTNVGFNVRAIVCDQGSNNRTAVENLKTHISDAFFTFKTENVLKKIYIIYDICHCIKNLRNSNIKYSFYENSPENSEESNIICTWKVFEELFLLETNPHNVTRCNTKLTRSHIYPNFSEKMKVKLATQIYSSTNAAAIRYYEKQHMFSEDVMQYASKAADFIDNMNKLFDALNSKSFKNPKMSCRGKIM